MVIRFDAAAAKPLGAPMAAMRGVMQSGLRGRSGATHTGALGTLLALSNSLWYSPYRQTTLPRGLTALDDQQLGGLIMWIPAGAVYAGIGLFLVGRWLRSPSISWCGPARSSR